MDSSSPRYASLLMGLAALLMPFFITLSVVNIFCSEAFVRFEYSRPGFPPAERFSPQDRLYNSVQTVHYVRGDISLKDLENLGVYNDREIKHLVDVRNVWNSVMTFQIVAGILIILDLIVLSRSAATRLWAARSLIYGGVLTLVVIAGIGLFAVFAFDQFFVTFHHIFFEGNSWLFEYTDSLIQFYPEPFWEAVSYGIASSVALGGILISALGWLWQRSLYRRAAVAVEAPAAP
ncbi:MAG: TIGR01906 family membrane protein [Rudaea sp.]